MLRKLSALLTVIALVGLGCGDDTQPAGSGGMSGAGGMSGSGGTSGAGGSAGTGGSAGIDAPMIDGSGMADAGNGAACDTYCMCMVQNCNDVNGTNYVPGTNRGGCVSMCAMQTTWNLTCRTDHCMMAENGDPVTQCPQAAGQSTCQ